MPTILFPTVAQYREALEEYLEKHAEHYIDTIGVNNWISMFEVKLLPEVCEILEL